MGQRRAQEPQTGQAVEKRMLKPGDLFSVKTMTNVIDRIQHPTVFKQVMPGEVGIYICEGRTTNVDDVEPDGMLAKYVFCLVGEKLGYMWHGYVEAV